MLNLKNISKRWVRSLPIYQNFKFAKFGKFNFSSYDLEVPTIDLDKFLNKSQGWEQECKIAAECLHDTGILVVKDNRANEKDNEVFIKMMEKYFSKVSKDYYQGKKLVDSHPENFYQNGVTPEHIEKPKAHCQRFQQFPDEDKPVSECPPIFDSKWRFFWDIGERDPEVDRDMLVFPKVIPDGFPQWEKVMDNWGYKMLGATQTISKMVANGFGLEENTFYDRMKYGAHLLAPTASDLNKFNVDTIFAGVHYDLNFFTIHGKSNYGGLFIWLRNGKKKRVRVPDGCLLIQAGIQLEYLTGGECMAGFHEVVYTEDVHQQIQKIKKDNKNKAEEDKKSLWRISSTLFSHIRGNVILEPLGKYKTEESLKKYPSILTRDQVANELKDISLMAK